MKPERVNAFTDGVLAIVITIMVLELPVPQGTSLGALKPLLPLFGAYALSFINIGIFWSNHHHMLQVAKRVDGRVLWANSFLLFWLSLVPFIIRWIGEAGLSALPVAAYGAVLAMAAVGYTALEISLIAVEGGESRVKEAVGFDVKGLVSLAGYVIAVPVALMLSPWVAVGIYIAIAAMWLVPDRRFERLRER